MTAVTIQFTKIVSNEVKDNKALLEPSCGKKQMNFLANPKEAKRKSRMHTFSELPLCHRKAQLGQKQRYDIKCS